MRICSLLLILFFGLSTKTLGADPVFLGGSDPCKKDMAACDALAIEITKLDFQHILEQRIAALRGTHALCPDENPNCCPPELAPVCSQIARDRVARARSDYINSEQNEECPYGPEVCDVLGNLYCGPDSVYLPWGVCASKGILIDPCRGDWHEIGPGVCAPPPPRCGPDERWNGKICVPKKCIFKGLVVPCPITAPDELKKALAAKRAPRGNLSRRLQDPVVQSKAYRELHDELETAMSELDRLIAETTPVKQ